LTANAVIDVKNKTFEPTKYSNLDAIVSTSDLYQIIFYCNQLNSKVGGLVYPSSTTNEPIEVMLDSESELKLFIFSVNISENIYVRNRVLADQVYDKLLREI
jgi:5-methylcytosine-specific restriction endonuclease McrBC regulatory subunit McrC